MLLYTSINHIPCEDPWVKMWDQFIYFETEPTVKKFLIEKYEFLGYDNCQTLAYQNTHKMIYLSKQAREFFSTGMHSSPLVRPLLFYYGMVCLAKMVIISHDPNYPSHTALLAHGVTTRKLKKSNYAFLEDEVKVQKDGLLPYFIHLITGNTIRDTFKMKELIGLIPEISNSYTKLYQTETLVPVCFLEDRLSLPISILEKKECSIAVFCDWLNTFNTEEVLFKPGVVHEQKQTFSLYWDHPKGLQVFNNPNGLSNRLFIQDIAGTYYFWTDPQEKLLIPEFMNHFLIMYLLGMLCRYEGDLWGEIHFSFYSQDLFLIQELMHLIPRKFPNLILNLLFQQIFYFNR